MEKVARTEFATQSNHLDLLTLIYVLLGKLKAASVIWNRSGNHESQKLYAFLNLDFSRDENRIKAEKNAFALIGKQRFGINYLLNGIANNFRIGLSLFFVSRKN